jgi:hypothetical protein
LQEQGERLEERLAGAKGSVWEAQGAIRQCKRSCEQFEALLALVDKDLDEGKLPEEPAEVAQYAKRMVMRCITSAEGDGQRAINERLIAKGRVEGVETTIKDCQKAFDLAKGRLESARKAAERRDVERAEAESDQQAPEDKAQEAEAPAPTKAEARAGRRKRRAKKGD